MRKARLVLTTILIGVMIMGCSRSSKKISDNVTQYKIGECEFYRMSEGPHDGANELLIGVNAQIIEKYTRDGGFLMTANYFLAKLGGKNILFDSGYGKEILNNLEAMKIKPEQIDIVMLTHLHYDHIDGMVMNGERVFPNAKMYVSEAEAEYWTDDEMLNESDDQEGFYKARQALALYGDDVVRFSPTSIGNGGVELIEGVKAIDTKGHTPGHTSYMLESKGEKLLVWGDIVHALSVQMPHPEVSLTYDIDPDMARVTRLEIMEYVEKNAVPIAGVHIPEPSVGLIEKAEQGMGEYKFSPLR